MTILKNGNSNRRIFDQISKLLLAFAQGFFGLLHIGDVRPGTDDFHRFAFFSKEQTKFVAHPAVTPLFMPKTVLENMAALIHQLGKLVFDLLYIVGVDVIDPEVSIIDEILNFIAQLGFDIIADKGGGAVTGRIAGVDDGRIGCQNMLQSLLGPSQLFFFLVAIGDIAHGTDQFFAAPRGKGGHTQFTGKRGSILF